MLKLPLCLFYLQMILLKHLWFQLSPYHSQEFLPLFCLLLHPDWSQTLMSQTLSGTQMVPPGAQDYGFPGQNKTVFRTIALRNPYLKVDLRRCQ